MVSIEERLNARLVPVTSGCIEFSGAFDKFGYGKLATTKSRWDRTHRIAWALRYGNPIDGMCVLHKCDNPRCCNTEHLFLGSKADNNSDKAKKGRGNQKLTIEQANAIRVSTEKLAVVAAKFGVSQSMVSQIRTLKVRNTK